MICGLANVCLAIWAYIHPPRTKLSIRFAMLLAFTGLWLISVSFVDFKIPYEMILMSAKSTYFFASLVLIALVHFCIHLPFERPKLNKYWTLIISIPNVLFALIALFSNYFVQSVDYNGWIYEIVLDPILLTLFGVLALACFLFCVINLWQKYAISNSLQRSQIVLVFLVLLLFAFPAMFFSFLIDYLFEGEYYWITAYFAIPEVFLFTYAMLRYRLTTIRESICKSLTYVTLFIIFGLTYVSFLKLHSNFVSPKIGWLFFTLNGFLFIILYYALHSIKQTLQRFFSRILLRGKKDYQDVIKEVSTQIAETLVLKDLIGILQRTSKDSFGVERFNVWLGVHSEDQISFVSWDFNSEVLSNSPEEIFANQMIDELIKKKRIIEDNQELFERIEDPNELEFIKIALGDLRKWMRDEKISMLVSSQLRGDIVAIFGLGKKDAEDVFTQEELHYIATIANQFAVAFENTKTYEQVYNELQATRKQVERSDRLAALGTLAAGVAHEIRNPMAAMVSHAELLKEKMDDKKYLERFAEMIPVQIFRVLEIVNKILDFSRHYEKKYREVDLNKLLSDMEFLTQAEKKKRDIEINYQLSEIPTIMGDNNQLNQVFLNLVLNGMQAMTKGGVLTIRTGLEDITGKDEDQRKVEVEIMDTGAGIAKENIEKIFDPFFTTRHEGTGLGLPTVQRIIGEHKGTIEVKSSIGVGTSFIIKFPQHEKK